MNTDKRMFKRMGRVSIAALMVLAGLTVACSGDEDPTYSTPEPRVATLEGSTWSVEKRPEDTFSTMNSIFVRSPEGKPGAIRVIGTDILVGRWNGTDWEETLAGQLTAKGTGDQLLSGLGAINSDGRLFALFGNVSYEVYLLAEQEDGSFTVTPVLDAYALCFDLALGSDGLPWLLYTDIVDGGAYVGHLSADGTLSQETILGQGACGSVAIDPTTEQPGALLWYPAGEYSTMTAALLEKSADAWASRTIATNGYYQCESCLVPQLAYRDDGVAVANYVDSTVTLQLAVEEPDELFARSALSVTGLSVQSTSFQRTPAGDVVMVLVIDGKSVRTATSSANGISLKEVAYLDQAAYPRMFSTSKGVTISFWGASNLQAFAPGSIEPEVVDADTSEGYQLGSFITAWYDADEQLVTQIFYNEVHQQ